MPFLNFGGNKNKHFNLSDMNFSMKNMKNRYSDPDPLWNRIRIHYYGKVDSRIQIRIHFSQMWISGSGSTSKWDGSETLHTSQSIYLSLVFSICQYIKLSVRLATKLLLKTDPVHFFNIFVIISNYKANLCDILNNVLIWQAGPLGIHYSKGMKTRIEPITITKDNFLPSSVINIFCFLLAFFSDQDEII